MSAYVIATDPELALESERALLEATRHEYHQRLQALAAEARRLVLERHRLRTVESELEQRRQEIEEQSTRPRRASIVFGTAVPRRPVEAF